MYYGSLFSGLHIYNPFVGDAFGKGCIWKKCQWPLHNLDLDCLDL